MINPTVYILANQHEPVFSGSRDELPLDIVSVNNYPKGNKVFVQETPQDSRIYENVSFFWRSKIGKGWKILAHNNGAFLIAGGVHILNDDGWDIIKENNNIATSFEQEVQWMRNGILNDTNAIIHMNHSLQEMNHEQKMVDSRDFPAIRRRLSDFGGSPKSLLAYMNRSIGSHKKRIVNAWKRCILARETDMEYELKTIHNMFDEVYVSREHIWAVTPPIKQRYGNKTIQYGTFVLQLGYKSGIFAFPNENNTPVLGHIHPFLSSFYGLCTGPTFEIYDYYRSMGLMSRCFMLVLDVLKSTTGAPYYEIKYFL